MKFVQSGSISTKVREGFEVEVKVEVPEVESIEEFVTFSGGDVEGLKFINRAIADGAKSVGRVALRALPEDITKESFDSEATPRIQNLVKGFTPQASDGRAVRAKKVETYDKLSEALSSGKELSREDLLALLDLSK